MIRGTAPQTLTHGHPVPEHPSLGDFVHGFLVYAYARQVTDTHERVWCPQWWRHPEALHRLHVLWRTYEELRTTGQLGVSAWWCDHADLHMPKLFDPDGPFKFCSPRTGHKDLLPPLPVDEAPAELFPPMTTAAAAPAA
ncbi:DUF4913 domain-containing protein [Nocardia amamiensis]|uniref:DUF4913 domain-containing protein n=1 Tax=Nocardia amamiensis TaxID=404578 RepID=UPI00082BA89C|nr:DUF4913 domain-containing protein [Nocardia amamiensis]